MKALVLEIQNGTAAVLREDGTVVKVKRRCEVGQTIVVEDTVSRPELSGKVIRIMAAAAAALVLFVSGGIFSWQNLIAFSYMSLDVNPSLEYSLNRKNKVIGVRALNDDAQDIVKAIKKAGIKNASVSRTIQETAAVLSEANYLKGDRDDYMLVGVSSGDEKRTLDIENEVQSVAESELKESVSVCTVATTLEERKKARSLGVSAGRYGTMKEVVAQTNGDIDELSEEELDEMSGSVKTLLENSNKIASVKPEEAPATVSEPSAPVQVAEKPSEVQEGAPEAENEEDKEKSSDSKKKDSKKKDKKAASGNEAEKKTAEEKIVDEIPPSDLSGNNAGKKKAAASGNTASATSGNTAEPAASATPATTTPAATTPAATTPAATTPAVTTPAVTTPAATTPAVTTPAAIVPTPEQIGQPQDLTVGEYEGRYSDLIKTEVPATTVEQPVTPAENSNTGSSSSEKTQESQTKSSATDIPEEEIVTLSAPDEE
ncbi:MAG: anti-sigma factor domain-containing protein [Lachnospiraceae bacterium]|nr:anti-sigma factor domain-containing protein [Lachnospiraceae bacterium]